MHFTGRGCKERDGSGVLMNKIATKETRVEG
jgi:hypothetical protein